MTPAELAKAHRLAREARIEAFEEYLSKLRVEVKAENAITRR